MSQKKKKEKIEPVTFLLWGKCARHLTTVWPLYKKEKKQEEQKVREIFFVVYGLRLNA